MTLTDNRGIQLPDENRDRSRKVGTLTAANHTKVLLNSVAVKALDLTQIKKHLTRFHSFYQSRI